jgi:hypothetical protein
MLSFSEGFSPSPSIPSSQQRQSSKSLNLSSTAAAGSASSDGLVKTITTPGNPGQKANLGDIATVKYTCYVPNSKPFAKATKQKMVCVLLAYQTTVKK